MFRFLLILLLLGIVAAFLWVYRDQIARWWSDLWGRPSVDAKDDALSKSTTIREPPPRPFSSFRNPIGREKDPRRVIVITFQAFEAWTRERGWRRGREETPNEFAARVASELPEISTSARQVIDAYNRVVYGRGRATGRDVDAAGEVWDAMRRSPQPRETATLESS